MQADLGFLMDSMGVVDLGKTPLHYNTWSDLGNILHALDKGVADTACCLVECGIFKVLPMTQPLLTIMLRAGGEDQDDGQEEDTATTSPNTKTGGDLIRCRAALSVLAATAWHLRKRRPDTRILGGVALPFSRQDPHHENDPAKEENHLAWI